MFEVKATKANNTKQILSSVTSLLLFLNCVLPHSYAQELTASLEVSAVGVPEKSVSITESSQQSTDNSENPLRSLHEIFSEGLPLSRATADALPREALETSAQPYDRVAIFGNAGDIPIAGDWDGDGRDDIGVKRGSLFYLDRNGDGVFNAELGDRATQFGLASDRPAIGDWNGDGRTKIGVYRAPYFYLDLNGNGLWDGPNGGDKIVTFGTAGDTPIVGDWNGDGRDDVGVKRGNQYWLDINGNGLWDGLAVDRRTSFGNATDTPIVGDWNGDGREEIGVHRGSSFYLDQNGNGVWGAGDRRFEYGVRGDVPFAGNWNGGVGDGVAVRRGNWSYIDFNENGVWNGTLASPRAVFAVNSGQTFTSSRSVTLNFTPSTPRSNLNDFRVSLNNGRDWSQWEPYIDAESFRIPDGMADGTATFRVQLRDIAGYVLNLADTIILDTTPPVGSVIINDGNPYTNSRNVSLTLTASDALSGINQVRYSSDPFNEGWSDWMDFTGSRQWIIPAGSDGPRTVHYQIKDGAGNISYFSDGIEFDSTAPIGSVQINRDLTHTSMPQVTLFLTATDAGSGAQKVRFSVDGTNWTSWETLDWQNDNGTQSARTSYTLQAGDGLKTVYCQLKDGALNISQTFQDTITLDTTPQAPALWSNGVFSLELDADILTQASTTRDMLFNLIMTQKFFSVARDLYDFLIFVPTLAAGQRLSWALSNWANDAQVNSYYMGAYNNVQGIGGPLFDYRSSFGSSAQGEFEGMVVLDTMLWPDPDFRFSTSDFNQDRNRILWENVLNQEMAHRFGTFFTRSQGNPLGILGRHSQHWSVFFDADFSPMDGNDWVDNGNGRFTLQRSFLDEVAFRRSTLGMPYNDLDLYSMGLLDPNQVRSSFVIDNPTLLNGQALRPYNGGPAVQIQQSDGTWSDPVYMPSGVIIQGIRRTVSLNQIMAIEGVRNPAPAAAPHNFTAAFVLVGGEGESAIDGALEKMGNFQTGFRDFFRQMTRNLGTLTLPTLSSGSAASLGAALTKSVSASRNFDSLLPSSMPLGRMPLGAISPSLMASPSLQIASRIPLIWNAFILNKENGGGKYGSASSSNFPSKRKKKALRPQSA